MECGLCGYLWMGWKASKAKETHRSAAVQQTERWVPGWWAGMNHFPLSEYSCQQPSGG